MSTTETKSLSIIEEDFGARPTVWVIDDMQVKPAYVTRHPQSPHASMEVVFHSDITFSSNLNIHPPFQPQQTTVMAWNVKESEEDAVRELLRKCWHTAGLMMHKLAGVSL